MQICSINVNGIRAAQRKGMFGWLAGRQFDVICMQETRASADIIAKPEHQLEGYDCYTNIAEKAGYSGVAIYSRLPAKVTSKPVGLDWFDREGRYVEIDVGGLRVGSLYLPSGSSGEERQALKYEAMDIWFDVFKKLKKHKDPYVICGDIDIAHKEIDLKNWRGNKKNSGFLPEEREWMTRLLDDVGVVDTFRVLNSSPNEYTWWSNRGQARAKNVGWRIDYQLATPKLRDKLVATEIYRDENFSDHAPLIVEYDLQPKG